MGLLKKPIDLRMRPAVTSGSPGILMDQVIRLETVLRNDANKATYCQLGQPDLAEFEDG